MFWWLASQFAAYTTSSTGSSLFSKCRPTRRYFENREDPGDEVAVSTEALERESRNPSVLGKLSIDNKSMTAAERKRVKPKTKENLQNWLSEDAAKNMFQDEPNQCVIMYNSALPC